MPTTEPRGRAFQDTTPYLFFVLLTAMIGPLLFGFHLGELNEPQTVITCQKKSLSLDAYLSPLPQCIPMSPAQFGFISSIFTVGGLVGALFTGYATNRYGRLQTMRYTTLFFTVGGLAEACAMDVNIFALGRVICGIGAGSALVAVPIYVSELAPPSERGFFGAFTQVMVNFGILIAQLLGLFLSKGQLWRIILGVGGGVGLNQLAALFFAVESPKWMAKQGHGDIGKRNLRRIRRRNYDVQSEFDSWGLEPSGQQFGEEENLLSSADHHSDRSVNSSGMASSLKHEAIGFWSVIRHPEYRRPTICVMVVMIAQQFTGINSIVMYGVELLSGLLTTSSAFLNVFVALINMVVTAFCAPLVDRVGRKPCLILSISGMGSSSLVLGFAILFHIPILAAISVVTFVGSFGIGLGGVPFILASELVGSEAVGAAQSWALAANWISTFIVAQFFPIVNQALGEGKVYFVFAILAAGFGLFVFHFVPETKGKADADEAWGRRRTD